MYCTIKSSLVEDLNPSKLGLGWHHPGQDPSIFFKMASNCFFYKLAIFKMSYPSKDFLN